MREASPLHPTGRRPPGPCALVRRARAGLLGLPLAALALLAALAGPAARGAPAVNLGIDELAERGYDLLRGKRVGLLAHPAAVNRRGVPTVKLLSQAPAVNLVALFGPEHGIYGDEKASQPVPDRVDSKTGLPARSLYGAHRKPTPEMLRGLDVLAIDLQDIGVRSYTFVSSMKLAVEACFENGVEVVVLDRPNPLGGLKVDGPPLENRWRSYVGAFPTPYVHGLTIGELARMAATEPGILDLPEQTRRAGRLTVVAMDGWRRHMSWPATGLRWTPTSPNIPTFQAAVGYAMTGLGAQIGPIKHGIGTDHPFRILTCEGVSLDTLERELKGLAIPGVDFERMPLRRGEPAQGLYVKVVDRRSWRPTELSFHMMRLAAKFSPQNPFAQATEAERTLFNKHVGSTSWWNEIAAKGAEANVEGFIGAWERQARQFQIRSRRYWLYD